MGRTCGEPDEIELTAMGVELNGSRGVRLGRVGVRHAVHRLPPRLLVEASGNVFRVGIFWLFFLVGIFLDFVRLTTRTGGPHGAYVRGAKRNRIGSHWDEIYRPQRVPFVNLDTRVFGVGSQRKGRSRVQPRS